MDGMSLLDVLRGVMLDPAEQAVYDADPGAYLEQYGYQDVDPADLSEAFGLVADTLPVEQAQAAWTGESGPEAPTLGDDTTDFDDGAAGDAAPGADALDARRAGRLDERSTPTGRHRRRRRSTTTGRCRSARARRTRRGGAADDGAATTATGCSAPRRPTTPPTRPTPRFPRRRRRRLRMVHDRRRRRSTSSPAAPTTTSTTTSTTPTTWPRSTASARSTTGPTTSTSARSEPPRHRSPHGAPPLRRGTVASGLPALDDAG